MAATGTEHPALFSGLSALNRKYLTPANRCYARIAAGDPSSTGEGGAHASGHYTRLFPRSRHRPAALCDGRRVSRLAGGGSPAPISDGAPAASLGLVKEIGDCQPAPHKAAPIQRDFRAALVTGPRFLDSFPRVRRSRNLRGLTRELASRPTWIPAAGLGWLESRPSAIP